jgi:hypothetical protein
VNSHPRGLTQFTTRVSSYAADGIAGLAQVSIDSPTTFPVAVIAISSTGTVVWQSWKTIWANIITVSGIYTMYVAFDSS